MPEVMPIRCSTLGDMNIHDPLFTTIRCSTLDDMNIHDPLFTTRGKADLKSDLQTIAVHNLKAYGYSHQLFKIEQNLVSPSMLCHSMVYSILTIDKETSTFPTDHFLGVQRCFDTETKCCDNLTLAKSHDIILILTKECSHKA